MNSLVDRVLAIAPLDSKYPKRSQDSIDLGLKLFSSTDLPKDWMTISACMYLAEYVAEENLLGEDDYVETDEECGELYRTICKLACDGTIPVSAQLYIKPGVGIQEGIAIKTIGDCTSFREAYFMNLFKGVDEITQIHSCHFVNYTCSLITMEAGSQDLCRAIYQKVPFQREWVVSTMKGLCRMHEMGVVHGDIKPNNLILFENGKVKICDFGTCFYQGIRQRKFSGTTPYMCLEMLKAYPEERMYGTEIDIWSMGVTIIELESGRMPYFQLTTGDCLTQIRNTVNQSLKTLRVSLMISQD